MAENRFRFTKTSLASVKCPMGIARLRVHDTECPGLVLRVTANGARAYFLYKKVNGRPLEYRLGTDTELTVEQARTLAGQRLVENAAGKDLGAERRASREAATLADLWAHYLTLARVKDRTLADYRNNYDRYLSPWASRRLSDISKDDVKRLHGRIAHERVDRESSKENGRRIRGGPTAANRTLALLSLIFNAGADEFKIGINPARGVKRVKESPRERYLSEAEMGPFMQAVDALGEPMAKDFIRVALFTGQRRANLQAMAWADISLPFATWTLERGEMKGGHRHVVPLVGPAMEILKRRREADPDGVWVFPTESKTGHITEPKKSILKAAKKAGIPALSVHDMRRTCATWLNSSGASEGTIAALLAHKRQNVTGAVYVKLSIDTVRTALEKAVGAMQAAAGVPVVKPKGKAMQANAKVG